MVYLALFNVLFSLACSYFLGTVGVWFQAILFVIISGITFGQAIIKSDHLKCNRYYWITVFYVIPGYLFWNETQDSSNLWTAAIIVFAGVVALIWTGAYFQRVKGKVPERIPGFLFFR